MIIVIKMKYKQTIKYLCIGYLDRMQLLIQTQENTWNFDRLEKKMRIFLPPFMNTCYVGPMRNSRPYTHNAERIVQSTKKVSIFFGFIIKLKTFKSQESTT